MKRPATRRRKALALTLLALVLLGSECETTPTEPEPIPDEAQELFDRIEDGAARREELEAELKEMPVGDLIARLETDSEQLIEPFNSPAYREAVSRGREIARDLAASIQRSRVSLLSLLALRAADEGGYAQLDPLVRLEVLVDAFRSSRTFNLWGLPHLYFEDAADALIELGPVAIPALRELLDDRTPAPVYGSEEVFEYEKYQYRVMDYALAFILSIKGERLDLPVDPSERDQMISSVL